MADRYLLESSPTDGYQLEDASGVLILETGAAFVGVLKRYTGAIWTRETLARYSGVAFVTAVLKRYTGTVWGTVDTAG